MDNETMAMHIVKNYDQISESEEMQEAIAVAIGQGCANAANCEAAKELVISLQIEVYMLRERIGEMEAYQKDVNRIIVAAKGMARASSHGDIASVHEECGDTPERSSYSWFEEAGEWENQLHDALERLDRANTEG